MSEDALLTKSLVKISQCISATLQTFLFDSGYGTL